MRCIIQIVVGRISLGFSWEFRFPETLNFLGDLFLEARISCKKQTTERNRLLGESGSQESQAPRRVRLLEESGYWEKSTGKSRLLRDFLQRPQTFQEFELLERFSFETLNFLGPQISREKIKELFFYLQYPSRSNDSYVTYNYNYRCSHLSFLEDINTIIRTY